MSRENLSKLCEEEDRQIAKIDRRNRLYAASEEMFHALNEVKSYINDNTNVDIPVRIYKLINNAIKKATE